MKTHEPSILTMPNGNTFTIYPDGACYGYTADSDPIDDLPQYVFALRDALTAEAKGGAV